MKISEILAIINSFAPFETAEEWDNCGLLVGDKEAEVKKALLALDVTNDVIKEAVKHKANLIITHHPVIFNPLKTVSTNSIVSKLIKNNLNVISAHTNLDVSPLGVSKVLANLIGIEDLKVLDSVTSLGYIGTLKKPISGNELAKNAKKSLNAAVVRIVNGEKTVKTVAVCGGAGSDLIQIAISQGADAYITGDVEHDNFVDTLNTDLVLIDAGHFATENPAIKSLCKTLISKAPEVEFQFSQYSIDPVKYIL